MALRLLLLQARWADDPMKEHERQCFVRSTKLPDDAVVSWDLTDRAPTMADVRKYDALSVGGSGDFYVSKGDLPNQEAVLDGLREVVSAGFPTFASCFGYQLMIAALGGIIHFDPERTEVGTFELALTDAGRDDPLFGQLPPFFMAQLGHKDRAIAAPDGIPNLAQSLRSPMQALRVPGQPIWATQFHPELDRETNLDRFRSYQSGYAQYMSPEQLAEMERRFVDSPEVSSLLQSFLKLVFS